MPVVHYNTGVFYAWIDGVLTTIPIAGGGIPVLGGVAFPATQIPSADVNTLDDYERGDWTPTLTFATPGDLSVAYSLREGKYTKIGNLATINYLIATTTFTHTTSSGVMKITGLPYVSTSLEVVAGSGSGVFQVLKINVINLTQLVMSIGQGVSHLQFNGGGFGVASENLTNLHHTSGVNVILQATVSYTT